MFGFLLDFSFFLGFVFVDDLFVVFDFFSSVNLEKCGEYGYYFINYCLIYLIVCCVECIRLYYKYCDMKDIYEVVMEILSEMDLYRF